MAFCANCGSEMSDLATACPKCGHPARPLGAPVPRRMEGSAVAALVLGIFGVISCPLILSIPAVIVGNQALTKIRQDASLDGEGLARAGMILGWIGIGLALIGIAIAVAFALVFHSPHITSV